MTQFVKGQTAQNAQALLAAAEGLGLDVSVVKSVNGGFDVPDEVVEALDSIKDKPAAKPKAAAKKKKEGEN